MVLLNKHTLPLSLAFASIYISLCSIGKSLGGGYPILNS